LEEGSVQRHRLLVALVLVSSWPGSGLAASQEARGHDEDRVCFYRDVNFAGPSWCYRPGDELANLGNRRNEISSIRIAGRARVLVFDQREFAGESEEFRSDVPDLTLRNLGGSRSWNDRIESFRVESPAEGTGRRGRGQSDRGNPFGRDGGICVYEFADYRGRSECWPAGEDVINLNRFENWNDRISSIRVYGRARARVHRDAQFRGGHVEIARDVRDLVSIGWDDQISSIEVR
jgi:hypothetical protein